MQLSCCACNTPGLSLFKQVSQAIYFISMSCHRLTLHRNVLLSILMVLQVSAFPLAFPSDSKTVMPVFVTHCVYHDLPCLCLPQKKPKNTSRKKRLCDYSSECSFVSLTIMWYLKAQCVTTCTFNVLGKSEHRHAFSECSSSPLHSYSHLSLCKVSVA